MVDRTKHFWETNYRQNIAQMIGICYRYTHDRQIAEDLAHDAFLLAIDKSASFENKGHFNAWLRRIVINVALQYLRDQKKQKNHEGKLVFQTELIEIQEEKQGDEDSDFTKAELMGAIKLLPEHHQLVFNLYVIDRFTHAQIAAELGISEGTSKSHLARARKKIKELLTRQLKEKKQRRPAFLFFMLPLKLWNIDHLFTQTFNHFEVQAQRLFSMDGFDWSEADITLAKPSTLVSTVFLKTGVAVLGLTFGSTFFNVPIKAPAIAQLYAPTNNLVDAELKKDSTTKTSLTPLNTATFSKNDIIAVKNNETMEEMKSLKTLGTLLMLSSALALDTPNLLKNLELLPVSKKQEVVRQTPLDFTAPIESRSSTTRKKDEQLSGTFYASRIIYTSSLALNPYNVLVVEGKHVKIDFNSQKFTGSGSFVFLDHIDYLLVDGVQVKLKETIKLKDKKYSLTELDEKQSAKKYGEHVKKAIEIALAE